MCLPQHNTKRDRIKSLTAVLDGEREDVIGGTVAIPQNIAYVHVINVS